ncbi:MAG: metallophosphoesterase family protein [Bryobacteraceae bacterium]
MARRLIHLSDIHFGRVDPGILSPLVGHVNGLKPHVVVVSGDLTQRARIPEFEQARSFLDRLPRPQIVVPGNHDVPLYSPYGRFVQQFNRFRRFITDDLEPEYIDREIAVLGINTARSLTWKGGRVGHGQISRVKHKLCGLSERVIKVVVTHHPFELPDGFSSSALVGRSRMAMERLAECGADLLLAGHLHVSHVCNTTQRYQIHGHSAIVAQAGTAMSTRGRGERNSFNSITVDSRHITVERWLWNPIDGIFESACRESYVKAAEGWLLARIPEVELK